MLMVVKEIIPLLNLFYKIILQLKCTLCYGRLGNLTDLYLRKYVEEL